MNQDKKKKLWKIGIPILAGIILLMGVSYAWFTLVLNGTKENVIKTGNLSLILGEEGESILLENAYPISTNEGLQLDGYAFEIKNDGNLTSQYTLYLDEDTLETNEERIDPKYIRYSLEKDNAVITENGSALLSTLKNNELIKGIISPNGSHKYKLKLWIDYDADSGAMNKVFRGKLRIEGEILEVDGSCFAVNGSSITGYNKKDSEGNDCPKDVVIPSRIRGTTITSIGATAFAAKGLTSVEIPSTVTTIADNAFYRNQLISIKIPSSVNKMGNGVFRDNQMNDEDAFIYNRNNDGSINYTSLNSYAGKNRDNVVFPSTLKTIGIWSSYGLGLKSITLPEGLLTIEGAAFQGNKLTSLTIPSSVISLNPGAFVDNQLPDNEAFIYNRNSDGTIDESYLLTYAGARRENITIPNNVVTIGQYAFLSQNISSVTIPNSVVNIGVAAFRYNNLTDIEIPSSVTNIGMGAFNGNKISGENAFIYKRNIDGTIDNTSLISYAGDSKTVTIPSTVTTLEQQAFAGCNITTVLLPDGLTTIKPQAFLTNNLTNITIPPNVTSIGSSALQKTPNSNASLAKIINQTGRSFDWGSIINNSTGYHFVTGTVGNSVGNVEIVSE